MFGKFHFDVWFWKSNVNSNKMRGSDLLIEIWKIGVSIWFAADRTFWKNFFTSVQAQKTIQNKLVSAMLQNVLIFY